MLKEILPLNRDYELTSTMLLDNVNAKTLYEQYLLGGSEFNIMIQMQGATGSAFVVLSGCKLTDMGVPSPMDGTMEQTVTIVPQNVSAVVFDTVVDYNAW